MQVIPGEASVTQHRILIAEYQVHGKSSHRRYYEAKTRWHKLETSNGDMLVKEIKEFIEKRNPKENAEAFWDAFHKNSTAKAQKLLGVSKGKPVKGKEMNAWYTPAVKEQLKKKRVF